MRRLLVLLGLGLLVGLLSACSGDDDDDNTGSGTGGSASGGAAGGGSASGGSASGGTAAGGSTSDAERPATCAGLCGRVIGCPGDPDPECLPNCNMLTALCPSEINAFITCVQARPDTDLECDEYAQTNIKPGFCDTQDSALMACAAALGG
jgi:hypothetical protein